MRKRKRAMMILAFLESFSVYQIMILSNSVNGLNTELLL
jgi:hypothetical protein